MESLVTILEMFPQWLVGPIITATFVGLILSKFRYQLSLSKSTYDKYLDLMLDYHQSIYVYYRLCQRVAHADRYRNLDTNEELNSAKEFLEQLPKIVDNFSENEHRVRLLLTDRLLSRHNALIESFNEFREIVYQIGKIRIATNEEREKLKRCFNYQIEVNKIEIERELRRLLRIDRL
jgi:uncharacterized protein with von Willebrand factor type A (vWA) domain